MPNGILDYWNFGIMIKTKDLAWVLQYSSFPLFIIPFFLSVDAVLPWC